MYVATARTVSPRPRSLSLEHLLTSLVLRRAILQPNVPIRNVTLRNVTLVKGITLPGVILCNETNPCTNINFDGVSNSGSFLVQKDYVCKSALGTVTGSSPVPGCLGGGGDTSSSTGSDKTHEDTKRSLFQRIRDVLHDLHV